MRDAVADDFGARAGLASRTPHEACGAGVTAATATPDEAARAAGARRIPEGAAITAVEASGGAGGPVIETSRRSHPSATGCFREEAAVAAAAAVLLPAAAADCGGGAFTREGDAVGARAGGVVRCPAPMKGDGERMGVGDGGKAAVTAAGEAKARPPATCGRWAGKSVVIIE